MAEESAVQGSDAFAERFVGVLNAGALALMASVGHRVGLFDTMASAPPSTSDQIAAAARLNERYVREWLAAMTTSGFVDHDPAAMTFVLPPRARRVADPSGREQPRIGTMREHERSRLDLAGRDSLVGRADTLGDGRPVRHARVRAESVGPSGSFCDLWAVVTVRPSRVGCPVHRLPWPRRTKTN